MDSTSIFYWRGSAEVRAELITALQTEGFQVSEFRSLESVLDRVTVAKPDLLIVDASAGEREASNRIVELTSTSPLYEIPVLFLSVQAQKRTSPLDGRFRRLIPVDIPFQVEEIISQIKRYLDLLPPGTKTETEVEKITNEQFTIRPTGRPSKLGGRLYAYAVSPEDISDDEILEKLTAKGALRDLLQAFSQKSDWLSMHAKRSSQLSTSLSKLLPAGLVESNNVQTVSLCFNWGFLDEQASLQQLDVFLHGLDCVVGEFAKCVRRSAQLASEHVGERAQRTLTVIGAIIESSPVKEEPQVRREAELALAIELTGRACWRAGYWSPHGAYRAMRRLQSGEPLAFDKVIAWALCRVLADAASARPTMENFCKPLVDENGMPLKVGASKLSESFEATIPISVVDLMPGMRLAQNLVAKDGAVVLEAMTELDEDLICRIWRLLAIRPLTHPVAVAAKLTNA